MHWQPTITKENLILRAQILSKIRRFFAERTVLEVETPLLSHSTVTDVHLHSFNTEFKHGNFSKKLYLQTSPEFAMKRLLAWGSGSIFQICKSFRQDESGRLHNPEFTMLEWYRIDFNHHQLMDEMNELLQTVLQTSPAKRMTYAEVFEHYLNINPHQANIDALQECARKNGIEHFPTFDNPDEKDNWLFLLMSHCIEPKLGFEHPIFIYDFPASQAALAKIKQEKNSPAVAERFEVYIQGMEIANGFHELSNAQEQKQRFENDLEKRKKLGLEIIPIDHYFLDALKQGFPNCAGVALGIDRLMMLAAKATSIESVISFPIERA